MTVYLTKGRVADGGCTSISIMKGHGLNAVIIDCDCYRSIIMAVGEMWAGDLSTGIAEHACQPVDSCNISFSASAVIPQIRI